ncbi:hypothetical protein K2173_022281 [Erythroxylum novogranatense]|uniref:C2 domain-containing protein n=1 Tax=Erythroxylum novogranatense TaxID=1862640 RepID=A0AAV8TH66_9ROSI|nr:hypothetical protein K2173_022281 [Erythroxylum novogranatense]
MAKIWIEVCLLSARGLRRSFSFWKLQWFAVGWVDPKNKYCTDVSGHANPTWKTKFAMLVEDSNLQDTTLHVEVYSREPIFLIERLEGTATITLKEFLPKYGRGASNSKPGSDEGVGSYQLRKRNSTKPQGFVDISVRISEEREETSWHPDNQGEVVLTDPTNRVMWSAEPGSATETEAYPSPVEVLQRGETTKGPRCYQPAAASGGPGYGPQPNPNPPPPPPPPPPNVGYVPTLLPRTTRESNYVNTSASFAPGLATGALAAGAMIFGDDFMSGFDLPTQLRDPALTISTTDPPF